MLIVLRQKTQQQVLFKSFIDSTTLFESTPAASSKILQKTRRLHLLQMMECKIENDLPVIENEHLAMQRELEKNSSVFICWPFQIKCKSVNQWDQTPLKKTASNFIAAYPCKLPTAPTVWVKRRLFISYAFRFSCQLITVDQLLCSSMYYLAHLVLLVNSLNLEDVQRSTKVWVNFSGMGSIEEGKWVL